MFKILESEYHMRITEQGQNHFFWVIFKFETCLLIVYFLKVLWFKVVFPIALLAHIYKYNHINNKADWSNTYFFYAEQRSSTHESSGNHDPMAIIPKYDRKSEMPKD